MSKNKPPKKKVVVTTRKTEKATPQKRRQATAARRRKEESQMKLIFGRENYILMAVGAALVGVGLLLMSGGAMPSPEEWDPDRIYSFRRTVLAPLVIIAGLIVEIVAIFKRSEPEPEL